MPGAVPSTSTEALTNATIKQGLSIANKGWVKACENDSHLLNGLNTHKGNLTYAAVGKALNIPVITPLEALSL